MKPKSTTAALAALLFSTFTVNADTITWDGGGADDNWSISDNWGVGTQFDSLDSLTFAGSTRLTPNNDSVGSTVAAITFNDAAGAFTLGGNAITLGGNIGFSAAPAAPITQTINMHLIMSSGRTFNSSSGGNGTLVVNGDISESGGTNRALTKGQLGTLFLNGDNSFTGALDIRAGAVSVNSIAATGSNSAIGAGSQISFGGPAGTTANNTLIYTGSASVTVNRSILLASSNANASGVIQNNSASGALTFTGTFTNSSTHITGTKNFTLGGSNAGANDFQSVIADSTGGGITSFTKSGDGVWLLSGANTFTGDVSVSQGTLSVNSVGDSGLSSALGAGTTIHIGSGTTTAGTLNYTGSGGSTNRAINLAATTTGGATITHNGANAGSGLVLTGTLSNAGSEAKTLILAGSNIDANDFQSVIGNGSGTLTVQKNGIGIWTLSGNNTFTGNLVIGTGTVKVSTLANSGSPSNAGAGPLIRIGGGTFGGVLDYTGSGGTTNRTIQIGNNSGTPGVGDTGSARIRNNGGGALVFSAPDFNATGLTGSLAPSRSLILGGTNTGDNEIQGVIADGLAGTMETVLAKENDGTWILSGTNTYSGITSVAGGMLVISGNHSAASGGVFVNNGGTLAGTGTLGGNLTVQSGGHQLFAVVATPGAQIARSVTGVLDLQAGHILDLTAASTPADGTYVLATAAGGITGTIGTVNLTGLTGSVSVDTVSSPNRLLLTVGAIIPPYTTWANTFLPGNNVSNPAGDNDNDGLVNQQEFAYGLSPINGSSVNPIAVQLDKTAGTFTYQRRAATGLTYRILTSTDLVSWPEDSTATAGQVAGTVDGNGNQTVVVTLTGTKPLTATKLFVRVAAE